MIFDVNQHINMTNNWVEHALRRKLYYSLAKRVNIKFNSVIKVSTENKIGKSCGETYNLFAEGELENGF
ncbi:hypothetical protein DE167_001507 [Clostridium beijerinckii]|uniref:Uncharacterized protein n=2 Tax=Clostridium beijerinckii TaxID=1520 RepID=A0AAX0B8N5_CLOBE|nr:hypothetical protein [Clostridium beijerinckii]NYC71041.1 hypothetical protein [Clostridium beijerinckii]